MTKKKTPPPRTGPGSRTGERARSGPSIPDAERKRPARRITLALETWEALDAYAQAQGATVSGTIEEALVAFLRRK